MNLPGYLKKTLENYRKIYQKFMAHTDEEMPTNDELLNIALLTDMEIMINSMKQFDKQKGESL